MSWLSNAIHHPDAPTLSAMAAWAAAAVALSSVGIQFFVGRKQAMAALISANAALINAKNAGRFRIAEFRQQWIENVIDTFSEQYAILATKQPLKPEHQQKVTQLGMRLGLLLNPDEEDTVALIDAMDKFVEAKDTSELAARTDEATRIAHGLLKREWVRIKTEMASD
jgi:hypothetical protein